MKKYEDLNSYSHPKKFLETDYVKQYQKPQKTKNKKSNLLLNFIVEINSQTIKISKKDKILIVHKPYGQN